MDTKQLVLKYYIQKKGVLGIQGILLTKHKINITEQQIREYIREFNEQGITSYNRTSKDLERADGGLKEIVKSVEKEKTYDYNPETGHVILYIDDIPHPLLVTTLDEIIASFSRKGKDWSSQKVQYEFQLTPKVWNKIKSVFKIYKDTVPFSIVTILEIPEGKFEEVAQEKAEQLVEAKMNRIYNDTEQREKDRLFREFSKAQNGYDVFIEKLFKIADGYKKREVKTLPNKKSTKQGTYVFSDTHIDRITTDEILGRINKMKQDIINDNTDEANIVFLGDIAELLLPSMLEMHPGQRYNTKNTPLDELIMLCVDILEDLVVSINNSGKKVNFYGLLGNHDRMSEIKMFDPMKSGGRIIYKFLQRVMKDSKINITICDEDINIIVCGNIKMVALHGDTFGVPKLKELALQYIETGKNLIFLTGDKHHLKSRDISDKISWIQSPALCGRGDYDRRLGLTSNSGYVTIYENTDGLFNTLVTRMK